MDTGFKKPRKQWPLIPKLYSLGSGWDHSRLTVDISSPSIPLESLCVPAPGLTSVRWLDDFKGNVELLGR